MDATTTDNDEALMLAYGRGSYVAFETLYRRYKGNVHRFYVRQAGATVAEELMQEAFIRLVGARQRYRVSATFKTFLWTLVRNVLVDHYRKVGRTLPASYQGSEPDEVADAERLQPDRQADQSRQVQRLLALVAALPAAQREVFLLREEGGLSIDEIAEVAGCSRDTVKSRLRYALSKLKAGMEAS